MSIAFARDITAPCIAAVQNNPSMMAQLPRNMSYSIKADKMSDETVHVAIDAHGMRLRAMVHLTGAGHSGHIVTHAGDGTDIVANFASLADLQNYLAQAYLARHAASGPDEFYERARRRAMLEETYRQYAEMRAPPPNARHGG